MREETQSGAIRALLAGLDTTGGFVNRNSGLAGDGIVLYDKEEIWFLNRWDGGGTLR